MPRFRKPPASFAMRTGEPPDHIVWRFSRTPSVERAFTAADAIDDPTARGKALLTVMAEALQDWEGVFDGEGRPLPYSPEALFEYIPAALRAQVLRRWIGAMLDDSQPVPPASQEADTQHSEEDDAGPDPERDDVGAPGALPVVAAVGEPPPEERTGQPAEQLAFALESASPPAGEAPLIDEPPSLPEGPRGPLSLDPGDAGRGSAAPRPDRPSPEPPARPAPEAPGEMSPSQSRPRVAQATSLRPLPAAPAQQAGPTPSAAAATPAVKRSRIPLLEAEPAGRPPGDPPPVSSPCADHACPFLDPDFDWQPLIRPAWEALHKQTSREETTEAAF